jgi:chloride channel protein, CIC family
VGNPLDRARVEGRGVSITSSPAPHPTSPSAPVAATPPRPPFWRRWSPRWRTVRPASWSSVYRDLARWVVIALPIGVVAGLGAVLFYELVTISTQFFLGNLAGITLPVEGTTNAAQLVWASSFPRVLIVPGLLTVGGLAVGALAWGAAPEIAGHGTDAAIHAFHSDAGRVRLRVPLLKTLASAITLGTGGSGGREGPVAQIGGGFGSAWANLVGLGDRDRRVALATGMGAGIGAIFRAPLGGAVYAAEIFYTGDFEPEVFVPGIIASVIAYSVYSSILGFESLFLTPSTFVNYAFNPDRLPLYGVLGVLCGGVGILFIMVYRRSERWFRSRPWHPALVPAAGAALAGAVFVGAYLLLPGEGHFVALSSLTVGYGFVQAAMLGDIGTSGFTVAILAALLAAVFVRLVMTSMVVGSGGSAGLFGTSVVVGAFLGTAVGGVSHALLPGLVPEVVVPVFSIVGMMSFFGGISKAPLGVLIMVTEMAGSYTVLPAAMLSIFVAYVITGRSHIYEEQLPTRIESPAHRDEYRRYFLAETRLGEIAEHDSEPIPPEASVETALERAITHGRSVLSVEEPGRWIGAARLADLLAVSSDARASTPVMDLARPVGLVLPSDMSAGEALARMDEVGANAAAVLSVGSPVRIVGIVTRRALRGPDPT